MSGLTWALLTIPMTMTAASDGAPPHGASIAASDPFSEIVQLDESELRAAAGGTSITENNIESIGVNLSHSESTVSEISADGSVTGQIANNSVDGNSGFTTIFNNTGNGVTFQNTMQVIVNVNEARPE